MIKLHLGCGRIILDGYVNIDISNKKADKIERMEELVSFEKNSIDEIYSSHAIEHIHPKDFKKALLRWYELLKEEGLLILRTPDNSSVVEKYPEILDCDEVPKFLQTKHDRLKHIEDPFYVERNYFSINSLKQYVENGGFKVVKCNLASQRHSVGKSFELYGRDEGLDNCGPIRDIYLKAIK
jgi:predicted SAM-dependent methyltransferase